MSIADKYFNSELGFGKSKQTAIELLKITIDILNEFNINYFLISGTLLGYARHNDFIPWDDDIDLIVELNQKF
jgi:lipopolysaccharide cholinephosphotransferase